MDTPGHRRFRELVKNQSEFARSAECSQQVVSKIISGLTTPGPFLRVTFRLLLGIDESEWLTEDERRKLKRIEKNAERLRSASAARA